MFVALFVHHYKLDGNCHEQLSWKRQPELFKFDSRRHRCKEKPHAYDEPLAAKEIIPDKRADSVKEKWPENLACCHKQIYLNACAAHDSFPLITDTILNMMTHFENDVFKTFVICNIIRTSGK